MWDFYGGRPWILKHVPRHGLVVEAGCGMGRYVFLLSRLGVEIEGIDFHPPTVEIAQAWGSAHGFDCVFKRGDVLRLPYDDSSLSGYLSFGVIEHFQQGPTEALAEAYRVLRPGGIAIITTPAPSPGQILIRGLGAARRGARRVLHTEGPARPFFQYWYSAGQLRRMITSAGLSVVLSGTGDLRYVLYELEARFGIVGFGFRLTDRLERTPLASFGAQALTISVKLGERMHCFLCEELRVTASDLRSFYLPICSNCSLKSVAQFYKVPRAPQFSGRCTYDPPIPVGPAPKLICNFCTEPFEADTIFDNNHGFDVPICSACLRDPEVNLLAANIHLKQIWRRR